LAPPINAASLNSSIVGLPRWLLPRSATRARLGPWLLASDLLTLLVGLGVLWSAKGAETDPSHTRAYLLFSSVACTLFWLRGQYSEQQGLSSELGQTIACSSIAVVIAFGWILFWQGMGSDGDLMLAMLSAIVSVVIARPLARAILHRLGLWEIRTLLLGHPDRMLELAPIIEQDWHSGYAVVAVLPVPGNAPDALSEVRCAIQTMSIDYVIVSLDSEFSHTAQQVIPELDRMEGLSYGIWHSLSTVPAAELSVRRVVGHDGLLLHRRRARASLRHRLAKRAIDLTLALLLLGCLAPLMILIAICVRADGGPALYASPRLGRNGRQFRAYKFRSMVVNSRQVLDDLLRDDPSARQQWERQFKLENDPRVTPIGRLLRRSSLDELPQFFNVLKGEMSLVGPRPLLPEEREPYGDAYALYCQATPGMTGMWQVCGRDAVEYRRRITLNSWYCANATLWDDLVILVKTASVVVRRLGAS
jgi:Undecaprenyl-phosphate galactose phosphotransferase WbaP